MNPRFVLRLEGGAVLAAALAAYFALDGPLWLLAVLALAPDLSMLGYLAGPRVGARAYNAAHTYTTPLAVGGLAYATGTRTALLAALVWVGHVGADRLVGYGLKYESGFGDTHLSAAVLGSDPASVSASAPASESTPGAGSRATGTPSSTGAEE